MQPRIAPSRKTSSSSSACVGSSLERMARRRVGTGGTWISGVSSIASRNCSICPTLRAIALHSDSSPGGVSERRSLHASLADAITTQKPSCSSGASPASSLIVGLLSSARFACSKAALSAFSRPSTATASGASNLRFDAISCERVVRRCALPASSPACLRRIDSAINHTWKRLIT